MKKALAVLTALIIVTGILCFYVGFKPTTSNLDLIDEFTFDFADGKEYKTFKVKGGESFTYFGQLSSKSMENAREHFHEEYGVELSEFGFDFDEYKMAIAIGRKIVDIKYHKNPFNLEEPFAADITFDNVYSDGQIYVYQMDKVWLHSDVKLHNSYYIMNGTKKEFVGHSIYEVNQTLNAR